MVMRKNHTLGDIEISTLRLADGQWKIVFGFITCGTSIREFRTRPLDELYTDQTFDSDEAAMRFAGDKLGVPLRDGLEYRLVPTGFRNICQIVAISN